MAEVHQLPDAETAEREASEWIARLNADDVTAEDRAQFTRWCAAHPRNARAYEALSSTWQTLLKAGPLVRAVAFGGAMQAAAVPPRRRNRAVLAAAAAIASVTLSVAIFLWQSAPQTVFQTAVGEHAAVRLPDGSSLELNSNSRARVEYNLRARIIRLERGEAYFEVAHDRQRPFWVVAGPSWVRAVGTAFNVYLRPVGVEVTVSEGTVKVAGEQLGSAVPSDQALSQAVVSVLRAGERAEMRGEVAVIRTLEPAQLKRSADWRHGTLYFENQPLGEVIDEISRYTPLEIEVEDVSLRRLAVGGTFQANPNGAEALLTMLNEGLGLRVRRDGDERVVIESDAAR